MEPASKGSYESYSQVMGGILEAAEIIGFLTNADRVYAEADHEIGGWGQFCSAWWEEYQGYEVNASMLFGIASHKSLLTEIWNGRDSHGASTAFGKAGKDARPDNRKLSCSSGPCRQPHPTANVPLRRG